jgi:hypothetical protein
MATEIGAGLNDHLWSEDHFVTQLNPDGTTRDFVVRASTHICIAFIVIHTGFLKIFLSFSTDLATGL